MEQDTIYISVSYNIKVKFMLIRLLYFCCNNDNANRCHSWVPIKYLRLDRVLLCVMSNTPVVLSSTISLIYFSEPMKSNTFFWGTQPITGELGCEAFHHMTSIPVGTSLSVIVSFL